MAETILFTGRVNGKHQFTYGPKTFNKDWGGAFTALEIENLATKLPKIVVGKRTPVKIREVGTAAEQRNFQMWVERLELAIISLGIDALMIVVTKRSLLFPDKLLSKLLVFGSGWPRPNDILVKALCELDLSYWGVVKELTLAFTEFDAVEATGRRSASVFLTI